MDENSRDIELIQKCIIIIIALFAIILILAIMIIKPFDNKEIESVKVATEKTSTDGNTEKRNIVVVEDKVTSAEGIDALNELTYSLDDFDASEVKIGENEITITYADNIGRSIIYFDENQMAYEKDDKIIALDSDIADWVEKIYQERINILIEKTEYLTEENFEIQRSSLSVTVKFFIPEELRFTKDEYIENCEESKNEENLKIIYE